jgi:beta-phosphoglucomutase-like phosphatase (HAD superfamily)
VLALIFDLDGTLIDAVYTHVLAWRQALLEAGVHRRIGMSGGLFTRAVAREIGRPLTPDQIAEIQRRHGGLLRESAKVRRRGGSASGVLGDI